jgi:hypothetical protein
MCSEIEALAEAKDQVEYLLTFPLYSNERDWYDRYQLADTDTCSRTELVQLLANAPTDYLAGLLAGKYQLRIAIEAMTGRSFK